MTVSTIYTPIEYAGDASTVAFPVPWMFLEADDLRITKINDATDAETNVTTFTTSGEGEPTGGTVVLPAAIGTGYTLRIERRTDRTQEMDLQPQGRFPAETVERSVDKLTLIVQELEESIGTGGTGSGTAVETIVTDDPTKVEITKTGTEVTINVLATNPTGPAGGDLAGTYPDPILKQGTGVGSLLLEVETDFSWAGWAGGSTLGGRGIAAGYAWFGDPGSQVHLPVWGASDAYAIIRWTRDFWATTVQDSSLAGIIGVGVLDIKPPCMAYVEIGGVWCWVLTSDSDGRWWYAEDVEASYNANGSLKVAAWVEGTAATRVMADIATSTLEGVSCMVGNHGYITRTDDWATWTDEHNTGGPVIGGIATNNDGTWLAFERDTGKPIRSVDEGLTWVNPTIYKRTGESGAYASATTLIPAGAVVHGNGMWLVVGDASYAYSADGVYWTVENSALGAFYGIGFDGVRYYATNPNNGTDPAIVYQLLVSSIPFHRQVVAERGLVVGGDFYLKDLLEEILGTDHNGKVNIARYRDATLRGYLDMQRSNQVELLEFIPAAQHNAIAARTSTWDAAEAFTLADAQLPSGLRVNLPVGTLAIETKTRLTKQLYYGGGPTGISGQGRIVRRRANVTAFLLGDEEDDATFITAPHFMGIEFQSFNTGALYDEDFIRINAALLGGFDWCSFNGDHLGAWLGNRRMQDMWFAYNIFRGGGNDVGDRAQIYFDEPQILTSSGELFFCNSLRMHGNHHEWGPSVGGTYTDPVTGLTTSGNRGSVAMKNVDTSGDPGSCNLIKTTGSKFEMTTSRNWNGTAPSVRKAAFQFNKISGFQFNGCEWNQTKFVFDVQNAQGMLINGTYNNTGTPETNERRLFGRFLDSENIIGTVTGYGLPGVERERCPGFDLNLVSNVNYAPSRRASAQSKESQGFAWLQQSYSTQTPGMSLVSDTRANGGTAIRSPELTTGTYGFPLLTIPPTVRDDVPNGLTFRFKACTETAPVGAAKVLVSYTYAPNEESTQGDGVTVTWPVSRYFAQETETGYTGIANVTAVKRNRLTGDETALTISGTTGADGNPNGGTITVTEAVSSAFDVVRRRASLEKSILARPLTGALTTTPTWYSVFIPPGVLSLENVQIRIANAFEEAGLRIRILDYDFQEGAECEASPYFPTSIVTSGGGLIPGGNGWVVGSFVRASNPIAAGCIGWVCTSPSGGNGEGSWRPVSPDDPTTVYTGSGGTLTLPALSGFSAVGARRGYINAGTGDLVVQRAGSDTFLGSTATSFTIGIGEAVDFEHVTATEWAIRSGVSCAAVIYGATNPTQVVATGAAQKVTMFNTNSFSKNCTADQANDKITATRSGAYRVSLNFSGPIDVALTLMTWTIKVGGTTVGHLKALEYFGAAAQEEIVCLSGVVGNVTAGQDIEAFVQHSGGGSVTVTAWNISLSAERIGG